MLLLSASLLDVSTTAGGAGSPVLGKHGAGSPRSRALPPPLHRRPCQLRRRLPPVEVRRHTSLQGCAAASDPVARFPIPGHRQRGHVTPCPDTPAVGPDTPDMEFLVHIIFVLWDPQLFK